MVVSRLVAVLFDHLGSSLGIVIYAARYIAWCIIAIVYNNYSREAAASTSLAIIFSGLPSSRADYGPNQVKA